MAYLKRNELKFSRNLWLTVGAFTILGIIFAVYVHTEKQIDRANEARIQSLLLVTELRQSSEDLTRLVRAYITSGVSLYKERYQEILEIRDGKRPRPAGLYNMYEELELPGTPRPQQARTPPKSFLDLALQEGVTKEEFSKLKQAKDMADALTAIDLEAMRLRDSELPTPEVARERAGEMLLEVPYFLGKREMNRAINDFYQLADQRTLASVRANEQMANLMRLVFIFFVLCLFFMLWRTYRALRATLGGSVEEVHARIVRIGRGDFSLDGQDLPLKNGNDNSVMTWLLATRNNLAKIDAARKDVEARNVRLAHLYKALGECNQAIVRCHSESELFPLICHYMVSVGGMHMAWIGVPEKENRIGVVASYGEGTEYLNGLSISIDGDLACGCGPTASCFREDRPFWCQDFQNDPATSAWHERGAAFGWRASAALPLHRNGEVIGVISAYASQVEFFDEAVRNLLVKLTMDIDYALDRFEHVRRREQALAALADSRRMLRTIIDTTPVRIFWKDMEMRYLGCNQAFALDTNQSSPEDLIGKDDHQLVWREYAERYRADDREVMSSGVPRLSYVEPWVGAHGKNGWVRTSKVPLLGESDKIIGVVGVYDDITEQKEAAERLQYLANYDTLTGLASRAQLDDRLAFALPMAKRNNEQLTLMCVDLDNFKDINDALGHSVGDAVLIELARRLRYVVREEDTIARLGGDEFVLLLPQTEAIGAAHVAQKLLDAIAQPYRVEQYGLALTASIGIAVYPRDGVDFETLFKNADNAMYQAKRKGRRGYCYSTQELQARSERNLNLISAMNDALESDQFQVVFQPQISIQEGRLVGAEALLRWTHPEFGAISPVEFIPVAEGSGLIVPLGEKVLRHAVRQARLWRESGLGSLIVGVNLSVVQFRNPDLPALVGRILAEEGFPPEYLDLELTESVAMHNPQGVIDIMYELHERGIQISIDDFGTGYSSLSYLKKFNVHKLKIDQSFVRDITHDPDDKAIVCAIIQMAKSLGLKTIAEGVESPEQMVYLREQGCDEVQGYFYSKPLAANQFQRFASKFVVSSIV